MDDAVPSLFDFPDPASQPPDRRPPRGRNRETWARTATAEVSIIDAAAVGEAAARAEANTVMLASSTDSLFEDSSLQDAGTEPTALDQLAWLIWPCDGLEELEEAGALRIISVESEVVGHSADRGTAVWTVTVKLTDVNGLRRLATQAHPDEAAAIADSLAFAWQRAADPFAPLRSIAGITWRPLTVDAKHLPARSSLL